MINTMMPKRMMCMFMWKWFSAFPGGGPGLFPFRFSEFWFGFMSASFTSAAGGSACLKRWSFRERLSNILLWFLTKIYGIGLNLIKSFDFSTKKSVGRNPEISVSALFTRCVIWLLNHRHGVLHRGCVCYGISDDHSLWKLGLVLLWFLLVRQFLSQRLR